MDALQVSDILREGIGVALRVGGPLLVLSMAVGVIMALFQAVTQIHEQTLSFILKLAVVVIIFLVGGNWMLTTLQDYALKLFELMRG